MNFYKSIVSTFKLFCLIFFFVECAKNDLKIQQNVSIDLSKNVKIAFLPWIDKTGLTNQPNWPKNQEHSKKLLKIMNEIAKNIKNKIARYSRLNRIQVVHQSQFPDFRIQMKFDHATQTDSYWQIPFAIQVYNQSTSSKDFHLFFNHTAKKDTSELLKKGFYYWGQILQNYKSTFPYDKITEKLFLSNSIIK